jgi:hypothetical protein
LGALQAIDAIKLKEQRNALNESRAAIRLIDADALCALSSGSNELFLPMIQPELHAAKAVAVSQLPAKKNIHQAAPELLASADKRHALNLLADRIEYSINELHNYLSDRFFVHTANVQRLSQ